jgi:hypothetical protein
MASAVAATSAASEPAALRPSPPGRPDARFTAATSSATEASGREWQMLGWLEDAALLLLVGLAFPAAILAVGVPIALLVRLLIEIGRLWR